MQETKSKRSTKRRGNGEGSIFQRPNGRWEACVSMGYDGKGKRIRRTVYGWSKSEVQEELGKLTARKLSGTLPMPNKQTVAAFLSKWLEDSKRPTIQEASYINYKVAIDKHIAPLIGGASLAKLTPAQVQGLYAQLARQGASANTRRLVHVVLKCAFKKALRWGTISRNPCDAVDPPRQVRREIHPLTPEQVATLLEAAKGDRFEALYIVAIGSGLRLGELFGLQWSDVDLKTGAVTVRHTLQELNGKLTLKEPKTKKSRRRVDLPTAAVAALHEHRKRAVAAGHAASPWVFCNAVGGPVRRGKFGPNNFHPLRKRAGLAPFRFHDLRHTSATLLLLQGAHPKVVQERLGHSQIGMTMDTYSHVLPGMQRAAADKLDVFLTAPALTRKAAAGA